MPIALPCLCFPLAKFKTEWKLSVTAGSTNTAVTDRTIRLYGPWRARAGGVGGNHIPFQKCANKMTYRLLESKTSKPNVSNNSSEDKKNTVKKSETQSHPFLQHEFSKMQLTTTSKSLQKSKLPRRCSASSQCRAEVHPPLNNNIHLGWTQTVVHSSPRFPRAALSQLSQTSDSFPESAVPFFPSTVHPLEEVPFPLQLLLLVFAQFIVKKKRRREEMRSGPFTEGYARYSKSSRGSLTSSGGKGP